MIAQLAGSLAPSSATGTLAVQTHDAWQWSFVAVAIAVAVALAAFAWVRGRTPVRDASPIEAGVERLGSGIQAIAKLPSWCVAGVTVGLWSLSVAVVGFEWDVAWHADNGRDKELFTVPHTLIVVGLMGIFAAAVVAIFFASYNRAEVGWRRGRLRVPFSSIPLLLMGLGALVGFPLDDLWHATYGIDVTMWSPTHLMMIGGASLATIPLWLMLREGGANATHPNRFTWATMGGVILVGLSTFQLEYDMGIPQWQILFQPVLMAAAMGIGLVCARAAVGRGGALAAAVTFIALRGILLLAIGPGLGNTLPRFPLYLGGAIAVEAAFFAGRRLAPLPTALLAGAGVAVVGLGAEALWTHVWFPYAWTGSLLPYAWIAVAVAITASVVGLAMGRVLAAEPVRIPGVIVLVALLATLALVGFHLPLRQSDPASATLSATTVGSTSLAPDRDGVMTVRRDVSLHVSLSPANAAAGVDGFHVVSWQGHSPVVLRKLVQAGPGEYVTDGPVPTGGDWKSLVFLLRGDTVEAVPVAMPADFSYNLKEIPAPVHPRTARFAPASAYLMREFSGGVSPVAIVSFTAFGLFVALWIASLALAFRALRVREEQEPVQRRRLEMAVG